MDAPSSYQGAERHDFQCKQHKIGLCPPCLEIRRTSAKSHQLATAHFYQGIFMVYQQLHRNNNHHHHWCLDLQQLYYNFCIRRWRLHSYNFSINIDKGSGIKVLFYKVGLNGTKVAISSCNSRKGLSSSAMTVSWLSVDIPDFWKQFTIIYVDSASQAETNICIPCSNGIFGRVFFFSTFWIIFRTTFLR